MKQGKMWSTGVNGQEQFAPETMASAVFMDEAGTKTLPQALQEMELGVIGPQGPAGPQGVAGPQGPKGDTGAIGPQGAKGDTGTQGIQGPKGDTGNTGPVGPAGPQGATGPAGLQGPQGTQGPAGADGHTPTLGEIGAAPAVHDHHSAYIKVPVLLGSGTNLNNLQVPGMYYCPANATVATFTNCPTGYALALLVEQAAGCVQTIKEYRTDSAAKVFIRRYYNGTWGAWAQVWDSNAAIPKANIVWPVPAEIGAAAASHTHTKANITDFSHTHPLGELSGITPAAIGAASASHNHTKANITDFPAALYPLRVGNVQMNFNWSGQSGQPPWLWGGSDGTNMYVYNPSNFSVNYANSAGSAGNASWLNANSLLQYGSNGLNYFNAWMQAGNTPLENRVPYDGWWHILRMNHANAGGYYSDIAMPFSGNGIHYRRVENGGVSGWHRVYDSTNIKHGTGTPSGGSSGDIYLKHS